VLRDRIEKEDVAAWLTESKEVNRNDAGNAKEPRYVRGSFEK